MIIKKERNSNLELFRIITMAIIVAHHYVVNSGLLTIVETKSNLEIKDIFLLIFGWGGKTGINCFVLITGYFMCKSHITGKKYCKLIGERYFYAIVIWSIFLISRYDAFSIKGFLKVLFPFFTVADNFTGCFLLFYLFIPFLNKLIQIMNKKEHLLLVSLCIFIYTILPSLLKANVSFNYVTWFIVLYLIASYIRCYPEKWFGNTKLWGGLSIISLVLSWMSVVVLAYLGKIFEKTGIAYFEVADCNKILALITAICLFMFFKNLRVKQNHFINTIAASTFGVLLIHANSDAMRKFLWVDLLRNTDFYNSPFLVLHAIVSVLGIYVVCTFIDWIRIQFIEKPIFRKIEERKE